MQTMENNLTQWKSGLSRTRKSTFGKIATFFGASEISPDTWEDLESLFIQSDIGVQTSLEIIDRLRSQVEDQGVIQSDELTLLIKEELRSRLINPPVFQREASPTIILIAGVNGSGKTTTIAKLGKHFLSEGLEVQFIAADTFRAAAIEQLEVWADDDHRTS